MTASVDVLIDVDLDPSVRVDDLERLVPFILEQAGARGEWTVAVVLTDDKRLRELHHRFMELDYETDVMTFPSSDEDSEAHGGDIVVSVERAALQAVDYDHSVADEVRFLVVHGLLHLCGWDDRTEDERARMWDEQQRLLKAFQQSATGASSEPTSR